MLEHRRNNGDRVIEIEKRETKSERVEEMCNKIYHKWDLHIYQFNSTTILDFSMYRIIIDYLFLKMVIHAGKLVYEIDKKHIL